MNWCKEKKEAKQATRKKEEEEKKEEEAVRVDLEVRGGRNHITSFEIVNYMLPKQDLGSRQHEEAEEQEVEEQEAGTVMVKF